MKRFLLLLTMALAGCEVHDYTDEKYRVLQYCESHHGIWRPDNPETNTRYGMCFHFDSTITIPDSLRDENWDVSHPTRTHH